MPDKYTVTSLRVISVEQKLVAVHRGVKLKVKKKKKLESEKIAISRRGKKRRQKLDGEHKAKEQLFIFY